MGTEEQRATEGQRRERQEQQQGDTLAGYVVPVDMAHSTPGVRPCTMAAALDVVGERWSLLALREIGYGVHTFARIVAFTGASRDILADRLRKLESAGIIERRRYNEHPPRYEYHLTQAGQELFPVTISLLTWGEKWAVDSPAVIFRHTCGLPAAIELTCGHCGEPITRESLTPVKRETGLPARSAAATDPATARSEP